MSQPIAVDDLEVGGYILSVTARATDDTTKEMLEGLVYRTIKSWLWIVESGLEKGIYTLPLDNGQPLCSVEARYADELTRIQLADTDNLTRPPVEFQETFGDARVTVWATFRSSNKTKFHLNSDDSPQVAVDTWLANFRARARIEAERKPQDAPQSSATGANSSAMSNEAPATPKSQNAPQTQERHSQWVENTQTPNTPAPAVEGAIVAQRAPNSNRPDYANGQLVSFTVTKIVASSNKGSAVYQMWTPLGSQYPTINVYKLDTKGKEKPDYKAIVGILATLNLSLDKPEAVGTWRLICKATHVPSADGADKEFLNVVSLTAI